MELEEIEQTALSWPERAQGLAIVDQPGYELAGSYLREIKTLRGEIEATFGPIIQKAHAAHKEAVAQRKRHEAPLERAENLLKIAMSGYALRLEKEARLERERRELEFREAEAKRLAEARAAEEAARLAEAEALEAAGMRAEADAVLEAPLPPEPEPLPLPPAPIPARPVADGIQLRKVWGATVVDLRALVGAIAEGKAPLSLVAPAESELRAFARATKGSVPVPGVRFEATETVAAKGWK